MIWAHVQHRIAEVLDALPTDRKFARVVEQAPGRAVHSLFQRRQPVAHIGDQTLELHHRGSRGSSIGRRGLEPDRWSLGHRRRRSGQPSPPLVEQ